VSSIIKVCGVSHPDDAAFVATSGATHIGFVFAPASRRCVHVDDAAGLVEASAGVRRVGVFQGQSLGQVKALAAAFSLDVVQLHGGYEPGDAKRSQALTGAEVWWAAAFEPGVMPVAPSPASYVLVDSSRAGQFGGTGEAFDWASLVRPHLPFVVAGGLNAGNVARAIAQSRCGGVDVSGGVELPAQDERPRKNHGAIVEFVRNAQLAFARNAEAENGDPRESSE
jgi:phosphoribosylanthranilate isomerase